MSEQIDLQTFQHLVKLAALDLTETEGEYIRRELNNQLKAIRELEAIPLDENVSTTSHGVPYSQIISQPVRPDVWQPYPNPEEILKQAPEVEDGYIIVPEIPHTTLD